MKKGGKEMCKKRFISKHCKVFQQDAMLFFRKSPLSVGGTKYPKHKSKSVLRHCLYTVSTPDGLWLRFVCSVWLRNRNCLPFRNIPTVLPWRDMPWEWTELPAYTFHLLLLFADNGYGRSVNCVGFILPFSYSRYKNSSKHRQFLLT